MPHSLEPSLKQVLFTFQLIDWFINTILDYEILSESTVENYSMYIKLFANTQYFNYFVDWISSWLEELSRTDMGRKFVSMVPGNGGLNNAGSSLNLCYLDLPLLG